MPQAAPARRPYRGVTPEERHAQRRERLLAAGLDVFGTSGYAGSTVRSVSAAASLNTRYFYESFASREELLEAVYQGIVREIAMAVTEATARAATTDAQAHDGLHATWRILTADRRKARVLALEIVGVSPRLDRMRRENRRLFADLLVRNGLAIARKDLRFTVDPAITARALIAGFMDVLVDWVSGEVHVPGELLAEHFAHLFTVGAYASATDSAGNPLVRVVPDPAV